MELDDEELEVATLALRRFRDELVLQMEGKGTYFRVDGSAWYCCQRFRDLAAALLKRIEERPHGDDP